MFKAFQNVLKCFWYVLETCLDCRSVVWILSLFCFRSCFSEKQTPEAAAPVAQARFDDYPFNRTRYHWELFVKLFFPERAPYGRWGAHQTLKIWVVVMHVFFMVSLPMNKYVLWPVNVSYFFIVVCLSQFDVFLRKQIRPRRNDPEVSGDLSRPSLT